MEPARAASSQSTAVVFHDGLGERRRIGDATGTDTLELLCLRRELTAIPSFEFALRERASRLAGFRHTYFGRVRSVDRLGDATATLAIASESTRGIRLSNLLTPLPQRPVTVDINASLHLIRQIVSAVAMLHESAGDLAHGAIGPERIIVTPNARVVIVEYVLGAALGQLHWSPETYWKELRVALPPSDEAPRFDQRADVTQIGVVGLSLILGRLLTDDEYPSKLREVLSSAWAISSRGGLEPLPPGLRSWLARALQLDPRHSFASALDARAELDRVLSGEDEIVDEDVDLTADSAPAPISVDAVTDEDVDLDVEAEAEVEVDAHHAHHATRVDEDDDEQELEISLEDDNDDEDQGYTILAEPTSTEDEVIELSADEHVDPPLMAEETSFSSLAAEVLAPVAAMTPAAAAPLVAADGPVVATPIAVAPVAFAPTASIEPPDEAEPPMPGGVPPPPSNDAWSLEPRATVFTSAPAVSPTPVSPSPARVVSTPLIVAPPIAASVLPSPAPTTRPASGTSFVTASVSKSTTTPAPIAAAVVVPAVSPIASAPVLSASSAVSPVVSPPVVSSPVAPLPKATTIFAPEPLSLPAPSLSTAPAFEFNVEPELPMAKPTAATRRSTFIAAVAIGVLALSVGAVFAGRRYFAPVAPPPTGQLSISSTPAGAAVVVDGSSQGVTPVVLTLQPGPHLVELRGAGEPRSIPVTMTAGAQMSQYVELPGGAAPKLGQLQVRTEPAGAQVNVDGVARGKSPVLVSDLSPGQHAVVVESDLGTVKQSVAVEAGATAALVVPLGAAEGAPVSGWISVSAPVDLQVFENKRLLGSSQTDRIMVAAGKHEIEIVSEPLGFRQSRTLQVAPGKTAPIKIDWPNGTIALNAVPWAEVWIDGKQAGETPIGNLTLPIGPHEVVFRHPDLGEQKHVVTVTASAPARLSVDLRRK